VIPVIGTAEVRDGSIDVKVAPFTMMLLTIPLKQEGSS
jgi:hypothetical protein